MPILSANDQIYSNMYKQTQQFMPLEWGLFFVRLFVTLSDIDERNIYFAYKISFPQALMVEQGIYKMKLNREQVKFILSTKMAALHPIIPPNEIVLDTQSYIVKATPDFVMPPGVKYANLSNNIFIIESLEDKTILYSPHIVVFEKLRKAHLFNRFTYEYLMSGIEEIQPPISAYTGKRGEFDDSKYTYPRAHNRIGLDGRNEVVVLTDSGIDPYHPLFYDFNQSIPINSTNRRHRKIVRFDALTNFTDSPDGHGTHLAGTIAGSVNDSSFKAVDYEGIAPLSKLYVIGISEKDGRIDFDNYSIPNIVERAYGVGGLIMNNAWGVYENQPLLTEAYNSFCYDNPDILSVFAVGNKPGYGSIASPADAKNVLSIGATTAPTGSSVHKRINRRYYIRGRNEAIQVSHFFWSKDPFEASYDSTYPSLENVPFVNSIPKRNEEKDVFVLLTKAPKCEDLVDDVIGYVIPNDSYLNCEESDFIVLGYSDVDEEEISKIKYVTLMTDSKPIAPKHQVLENSSYGPTKTGLFKPDLVAPGDMVYSAKAGDPNITQERKLDWNSLSPKSGTSVASAAVSGMAAIIRQYFEEGWYPFRYKGSSESIGPSSSLVKAMLIASAKPLDDKLTTGGPTLEYGFGEPHLDEILGIDLKTEEGSNETIGLRVFDQNQIGSKEQHVYTINVQYPGQDLVIAMSYLDLSIDSTAMKPLVVDLDLILIEPNSTKIHYGNQNEYGDDNFATNERIIIKNAKVGEYTLLVTSSKFLITNKTVEYAVVIKGGFNNTDVEANPLYNQPVVSSECIIGCKGIYNAGTCNCENNNTGYQCEHEIMDVMGDYSFVFHPKEVRYFKVSTSLKTFFALSTPNPNITAHYCVSKNRIRKIADFELTCNYTSSMLLNFFRPKKELYVAMWAVTPKPVNISFTFRKIDPPATPVPKPTSAPEFIPDESIKYGIDYAAITTCVLMIIIVIMRCLSPPKNDPTKCYSSKQSKLAAEGKKLVSDDKTLLATNVLYDTNDD